MKGIQITGDGFFNDTSRSKSAQAMSSSCLTTSFMKPEEVLDDPGLTQAEKREVLASWASDVRAVPGAPQLRQLDNGAVVRVDDVLRALKSLDAGKDAKRTTSYPFRPFAGRRVHLPTWLKSVLRRSWSDDDDDPPPCPAVIARPPRGPLLGGETVNPGLLLAT